MCVKAKNKKGKKKDQIIGSVHFGLCDSKQGVLLFILNSSALFGSFIKDLLHDDQC